MPRYVYIADFWGFEVGHDDEEALVRLRDRMGRSHTDLDEDLGLMDPVDLLDAALKMRRVLRGELGDLSIAAAPPGDPIACVGGNLFCALSDPAQKPLRGAVGWRCFFEAAPGRLSALHAALEGEGFKTKPLAGNRFLIRSPTTQILA